MVFPNPNPNGSPSPWTTSASSSNQRRGGSRTIGGGGGGILTTTTALIVMATALPSFFLGTQVSLYAGLQGQQSAGQQGGGTAGGTTDSSSCATQLNEMRLQGQQLKETEAKLAACEAAGGDGKGGAESLFPPDGFGHYVAGMARVDKDDFIQAVDPGVPVDPPSAGASEVVVLYSNPRSMPSNIDKLTTSNPKMSMQDAVANCHQLNVILADHSGNRQQCFAVVPQYESYHIQKWMRLPPESEMVLKGANKVAVSSAPQHPLRFVSRGQLETGRDAFKPPPMDATRQHWELLKTFLANVDAVLDDLTPLLKGIVNGHNQIIVMVCNFGQSELLVNFACAARARKIDLGNVVVFTTDRETTDIVEGLGLAAYYDHRNFADIPAGAARRYGDPKFVAMMMAKVLCVLYVSWLGYDMLFQDVDIVWFKDPLQYFSNTTQYDIFFQDDGGHSLRYAPYSANSGFYYVRSNDRTRHFLTALLMAGGDMVISTHSHQQALIALLQEHVSLHGLKAKVLSRDMEEFPGGYQYNQKTGKYMKAFYAGELHPYIFHMSWTLNKDNKLLYFRQFGEWYVKDACIAKKREEIDATAADLSPLCCSAEPLVSCHYRDKPSKIPCKDSPPIDKGRPSFW